MKWFSWTLCISYVPGFPAPKLIAWKMVQLILYLAARHMIRQLSYCHQKHLYNSYLNYVIISFADFGFTVKLQSLFSIQLNEYNISVGYFFIPNVAWLEFYWNGGLVLETFLFNVHSINIHIFHTYRLHELPR